MPAAAPSLQTVDLGPSVASRRLWHHYRNLCQIEPSLSELIAGGRPLIRALPAEAAGYRFQSVPRWFADVLPELLPGMAVGARQDFPRHYIDMALGFDAYMAGFSGKTRSTLRRKTKKLVSHCGGTLDIRSFHRAEDIGGFFEAALPLSARTYQDRLLDAGLPADAEFQRTSLALATRGDLRAWVLYVEGRAAAYLYLPVQADTLRYDYLGYDPAHAPLSVGTVLQMHALEETMGEKRFSRFDFTSGDGAHKRLFATDQIACSTLVMLRGGVRNRLTLGIGGAIDDWATRAGEWADRIGVKAAVKKAIRR